MQHQISVRITAADAETIQLRPDDDQQSCARCQAGQGCDSMPWFRGLFRQDATLTLPQPKPPLQCGEKALLSLEADIINRLSFYTYALPLLLFILTLWLTQTRVNEGIQLLCSVAVMTVGFIISRRYCNRLLYQKLSLNEASTRHPQIFSVATIYNFKKLL